MAIILQKIVESLKEIVQAFVEPFVKAAQESAIDASALETETNASSDNKTVTNGDYQEENDFIDRSMVNNERNTAEVDYALDEASSAISKGDFGGYPADLKAGSNSLSYIATMLNGQEVDFDLANGDILTIDGSDGKFLDSNNILKQGSFYLNGEKIDFRDASRCIRDEINTRAEQKGENSLENQINSAREAGVKEANQLPAGMPSQVAEIFSAMMGKNK